jgi:predicted nucleic acid-binding protein
LYLLDTNVVSEMRRPKPHGAVSAWLRDNFATQLCVSAMTIGELQAGVEILREQDIRKAAEIEDWIDRIASTFQVIAMDGNAFRRWARIQHRRSYQYAQDAMIAATAEEHGFIVATRNVKDFEKLGARTFNPFEYRSG